MTATAVDLVPLIRSGDFVALRDQLSQLRPPELAAALVDLRSDEQVIAFRVLPRRLPPRYSNTCRRTPSAP